MRGSALLRIAAMRQLLRVLPFFLFILVPVAEIALFIWVGSHIGVGWTILLILASALTGATLLRVQGLAVWRAARAELKDGRLPVGRVADGALLLAAGLLLLTPGFLTDTIGFALFVPAVRQAAMRMIWRVVTGLPARQRPPARPRTAPPVIEGEAVEIDGRRPGER